MLNYTVRYLGTRRKGVAMPLSEHEQRILAELEDSLSKQDPRFAEKVEQTNIYSHGGRRVRWGVAGFIAGLALLLVFLSTSILLSLAGVALMFFSAIVVERNASLMGRASWRDITRPGRGDDAHTSVGPRTDSLRDWLSRQRRRSE